MTRIKSTLVLPPLCANYRRLQDPLPTRHIQKAKNLGHGRTPTWRKVTTEIVSPKCWPNSELRSAPGRQSQFRIFLLDAGRASPPSLQFFNELSEPRQSPAQVQSSSGLVPGEGKDASKEKG